MAKRSRLPSFTDYQTALQDPGRCFRHPELRAAVVESDLWGLPRVRSGGFALAYHLASGSSHLALRCFHRPVPDRQDRYAAISEFLGKAASNVFVPIRYLPQGVLVHGTWHPVTFMEWIDGDTLDAYVVRHHRDPRILHDLSLELLRVARELERMGVAHGDLSHRNILVKGGRMLLVDYDGMYVPRLQGRTSCELGNVHFQSPARTETHFHAGIDRFSTIVLYLALRALAHEPALLNRYETGGEGLLFKRDDFLDPHRSLLLRELDGFPDLAPLVAQFRQVCMAEFDAIPRLADVVGTRAFDIPRREHTPAPTAVGPAIDATQRSSLLARVGETVTVVGRVVEVFRGTSSAGGPHIFLNCGHWRFKCFTVVIWDGAFELFEACGASADQYAERWVAVGGLLTSYQGRPQIAVVSPSDVQMLADEVEAWRRLGKTRLRAPVRVPVAPVVPVRQAALPPPAVPPAPRRTGAVPAPPAVPAKRPATPRPIAGPLDQSRAVVTRVAQLFPAPPAKK